MTSPLIDFRSVTVRYPVEPMVKKSLKDIVGLIFHRNAYRARFIEALREMTLSINAGDRVGVIGANGAGKSTLLRTIANIYPVAEGRLTTQGRVNGMFDLGVGFEMSDTGRENIYLRGYLLGLTRKEIQAIEDDVVDFSGLGQFIDLPLKSYSAGMQVRLAFAISTAIEAEILLIDEVIGAGDAEFHQRARSRLHGMIAKSKCMVLVSHDINTIREFCNVGLWLDNGRLKFIGPAYEAIERYEDFVEGAAVSGDGSNQESAARRRPIDFVRTRPMFPNVSLSRTADGVEFTTTGVPWSFTAEFPLTRFFHRPGVREAVIRLKMRVLEGQMGAGIVDSSYLKMASEVFYSPGTDHDVVLHASKAQHPGAVMFRKGAGDNRSKAIILDLQIELEGDEVRQPLRA